MYNMKDKIYKFLDVTIKVVSVGLFLFIMYWALTFLYETAKIIFK
jgi:hypothetical protein